MPPHRNTQQKAAIEGVLKESRSHITAEDVIDILKANGTPVGRATVYRCLKELTESGRLKKYALGEKNSSCYSYVGENSPCSEHYHLMCESCGRLEHIESGAMRDFSASALKSFGFEIDEGKTVFYGFCKDCKKRGVVK